MGLAGVVAGLKGGRVTFSDYQDDALSFALSNAQLNGVRDVRTHWGDWRNFTLNKKYDWILCSDIMYNYQLAPYVEQVLINNLRDDGQLLISHARRQATFMAVTRLIQAGPFTENAWERKITLENPYVAGYGIAFHYLKRELPA